LFPGLFLVLFPHGFRLFLACFRLFGASLFPHCFRGCWKQSFLGGQISGISPAMQLKGAGKRFWLPGT
jgi:hypothetical protein